VLVDPVTVAENTNVPPALITADAGVTDIATVGTSVNTALATKLALSTLIACTCTFWFCERLPGTVYTAEVPLATRVPTAGDNDQVTPLASAPVTFRLVVWELVSVAEAGVIFNAGTSVITEDAAVGFAVLVAVIVIACAVDTTGGAV
jgi:hypothetical protein